MHSGTGLLELGWNTFHKEHFGPFAEQGFVAARVVREDRRVYLVCGECGQLSAEVAGKLVHAARLRSDFPAVGDWVAVRPRPGEARAIIHAVLPRTSKFSRKVSGGRTDEQVLAANVDTAFLVSGLDGELNPPRISRYVTVAWDSGATPVIVLNKADVCGDVDAKAAHVEAIAPGAAVHAVSATRREGLEALRRHLGPGRTGVLLGSSGVGKSTLINALLGEERFEVRAVREIDSKGRHTTTRRELVVLAGAGVLIDTPGLRELGLWAEDAERAGNFDDVETLAARCRFRDCQHCGEPGCAVQAAVQDGTLTPARVQGYRKLKRETRAAASRQARKQRLAAKAALRTRRDRLARKERKIMGRHLEGECP